MYTQTEKPIVPLLTLPSTEPSDRGLASDRSDISDLSALRKTKRKDPVDEYFRMCVLATKLSHQSLDAICSIKARELEAKAKREMVGFERMHKWVEKEVNQVYLKQRFSTNAIRPANQRTSIYKRQVSLSEPSSRGCFR